MEIKYFNKGDVDDASYFAVAIITRYKDKWVMCKHSKRETWEAPGGRREENEAIDDTASRELFEETGAIKYTIRPISGFSVERNGMLYYAEVEAFGELPDFEMERIEFFDELPENLTYPFVHRQLFDKVKEVLHKERL